MTKADHERENAARSGSCEKNREREKATYRKYYQKNLERMRTQGRNYYQLEWREKKLAHEKMGMNMSPEQKERYLVKKTQRCWDAIASDLRDRFEEILRRKHEVQERRFRVMNPNPRDCYG